MGARTRTNHKPNPHLAKSIGVANFSFTHFPQLHILYQPAMHTKDFRCSSLYGALKGLFSKELFAKLWVKCPYL